MTAPLPYYWKSLDWQALTQDYPPPPMFASSTGRLSADALTVLKRFSWPGNIKQLQAVLEMAFFHTPGLVIGSEQVKLPGDKTLGKSWKYDRDAFIEAWKAAGGNISRLANMLDVSRVTLYRYLKKYDLGKKEDM